MSQPLIATQAQERVHSLNMRRIGMPVGPDDRVPGYPASIYDDPPTAEEQACYDAHGVYSRG